METLLLLGGSRYLLPVIETARALGCRAVTCDDRPANPAHRFADASANVSVTDREAVLALAERLGAAGVLSFACDPGVVTAAYVAEKLSLPSCGPAESVALLQNKVRFRRFLAENGFNAPWFQSFREPAAPAEGVPYPVIVKPADSAGSKGVSRAEGPKELEAALGRALACSRSGEALAEELIPALGGASDSECFSVDGRLRFCSFSRQYFDPAAENPYVPAGFSWPSAFPEETRRQLRSELQRLLSLLGMGTSLYNAETRLGPDGRVYIMELSPRGGGNRLCEMLRRCCGADLIRCAVLAALGRPLPELRDPVYEGCWAELILHSPRRGRFAGLDIAPSMEAYIVEKDLWAAPGQAVEPFTGANMSLGTLVLRFPGPEELEWRMRDPGAWLRVRVEA